MKKFKDILLCNEDTIKTYTNLNDNTQGDYIAPAMYIAQNNDLERVIGTRLLRKLQELVGTGEIEDYENETYQELLDDYITDFLAYATIVRLIPVVSFKIGNSGAVRTEDEKVEGMAFGEVFSLTEYYQNQADYLAYRLQKYLVANYNNFPELGQCKSIEDIKSNLYSACNASIWLGGKRGKRLIVNEL